jgi:hypothetical protein
MISYLPLPGAWFALANRIWSPSLVRTFSEICNLQRALHWGGYTGSRMRCIYSSSDAKVRNRLSGKTCRDSQRNDVLDPGVANQQSPLDHSRVDTAVCVQLFQRTTVRGN